jgi:preprotein translocase subunit SecD
VSPSSSRAQKRQRRNLLVSVLIVIAISLGSFTAVFAAKWSPRLGLDLAGGLSVVYQTQHKVSASQLNEAVNILDNRVDGLGVSGAQVSSQVGNGGTDEIAVSIPGVKNAAQVLNDIGQVAQMYFRPVLCFAPPLETTTATKGSKGTKIKDTSSDTTLPACAAADQATQANIGVTPNSSVQGYAVSPTFDGIDPQFATIKDTPTSVKNYPTRSVLLPGIGTNGKPSDAVERYVLGPEELTGQAIGSATASLNQTGSWVVDYTLAGTTNSNLWDKVADENFHQYLAIELDGVVYSAPIIQPGQAAFSSFDGNGEISGGGIDQADADRLQQAMQFGSLPVRLKQLTTQTVTPTLGKSSLKAGLGAGLVGLILVLLYVLLYYRALGLVVISGLALTAALLWAIISALGHTTFSPSFDLAGITGLIVSIGITVDSYIVYFERLKDETRSGRSIRTSVDRGFKSAWRTVWAADFVSLLAAIILYLVAVGDVKGFAFFLGLSTIMDMAVTWFYTRPLVILLGRSERSASTGRFGIARGLNVQPSGDAGLVPLGAGGGS